MTQTIRATARARRVPGPRQLLRVLVGGAMVATVVLTPAQGGEGRVGSPAVAASTDDCGVVTTKPDGSPWTCSFVDNFDGRSLDPDKWITQRTADNGVRGGETCFIASNRNIGVSRGELLLAARKESRPFVCESPSGDFITAYTGGLVGTRTKFSQAYGKFEVRARYPRVTRPGLHGGFWMYPYNLSYGPWPASGEIDVAEWWSSDPTLVLPSLHFIGRDHRVDSGWSCRVATPHEYHTYTVVWLPTEISFFIDGTVCFTRMPTPAGPLAAPQPFDEPFSMILTMGVGTARGLNAVSLRTPLPAMYRVDYAKAWR